MAFSATIQPAPVPVADKTLDTDATASLLSMLVLSVYAAQKSNKSFRKLKRRFLWTALKLKAKTMFSKKRANVSDRTLIIILLGVLLLILVFVAPLLALILAIVALVLLLAGVI
jgi:hypothetical protein